MGRGGCLAGARGELPRCRRAVAGSGTGAASGIGGVPRGDEQLWETYIQLTEAEAAFRVHKSDLSIRPIGRQKQDRVLAHILVCFLACVLWKSLSRWRLRAGLGHEPRRVFEELGKIRLVDVVLPTRQGTAIRNRCVTRPTDHQAILLQHLGLRLPAPILSQALNPAGPRVQFWGWDLRAFAGSLDSAGEVQLAYGDVPANLVRFPIFAQSITTQLQALSEIRKVNPNVPIYASLKLDGASTFPSWVNSTDHTGKIFGNTVYRPDPVKYASLLTSFVEFMADQGYTISHLGPGDETGQALGPARFGQTVENLKGNRAARNLPIPTIVGPDSYSLTPDGSWDHASVFLENVTARAPRVSRRRSGGNASARCSVPGLRTCPTATRSPTRKARHFARATTTKRPESSTFGLPIPARGCPGRRGCLDGGGQQLVDRRSIGVEPWRRGGLWRRQRIFPAHRDAG